MASHSELPAERIPSSLLGQCWRHRWRYAAGVLLLAAYQGLQYVFDTRMRDAVNAALASRRERAAELGLWLVGIAVLSFGIRVASRVIVFNAGRLSEYELRKLLLHKLHRLGPSFYRTVSTGDVMSRATNDLGQVRMLFGFGVLNTFNTAFAFASAMAVMVQVSVRLMLAAFAIFPVLLVVMRYFAKHMFVRQRENQAALGEMGGVVQSSIAGVRVVRAFAIEEAEERRFERSNLDYQGKALALARLRGMLWPVMQGLTSGGLVIVLLYGGHLMLEHQLGSGELLAFFRALSRLTWPLISLGFVISMVQRGRAAHARLAEVFDAEPDTRDGPGRLSGPLRGELSVRGLSFAHGQHVVLDHVSFELEPGRSLAIVGKTGSGKSTLAALLVRLQSTPRGAVFLDGVDVCELPLATLRRAIGYVQQTPFLFSTTVGRNIGYVLDEPDSPHASERIRAAAREAEIYDEVMALPDGFDTVVGERGVQLSGGQKQRTALARGLLAQPSILVLDDPLSAVDARTEKAILEAIDRQRSERSVVLITHRVAAAARCDQVLVLDDGRIVERGRHDDLVAAGGLYATFAEEQRLERELERLAEVDLLGEDVARGGREAAGPIAAAEAPRSSAEAVA